MRWNSSALCFVPVAGAGRGHLAFGCINQQNISLISSEHKQTHLVFSVGVPEAFRQHFVSAKNRQ